MNWYLLVRFIHILSSIVFVGGILARQAVRMHGKRSTDIHTLAAYFSAAGKIESLMVIPGNMLVIVFGVILISGSSKTPTQPPVAHSLQPGPSL